MWVLGKATELEVKRLEEMGWQVDEVDVEKFNAAVDPYYSPLKDDFAKNGDKLVSVWVDANVFETFVEWNRQERENRI